MSQKIHRHARCWINRFFLRYHGSSLQLCHIHHISSLSLQEEKEKIKNMQLLEHNEEITQELRLKNNEFEQTKY
jgi:hypothetical protein